MTVDFEIDAAEVTIEPKGQGAVRVRIRNAYLDEVIQQLGEEDILEEIGSDKCKEHFDLKDNEE